MTLKAGIFFYGYWCGYFQLLIYIAICQYTTNFVMVILTNFMVIFCLYFDFSTKIKTIDFPSDRTPATYYSLAQVANH